MKPEAFSMHNTRGVHDVVMYVCVCAHYAPSVTHACEVGHYTGIHACTEAQQTQLPVVHTLIFSTCAVCTQGSHQMTRIIGQRKSPPPTHPTHTHCMCT